VLANKFYLWTHTSETIPINRQNRLLNQNLCQSNNLKLYSGIVATSALSQVREKQKHWPEELFICFL